LAPAPASSPTGPSPPVRGVIKAILKHPGEGVQSLETVFVIQPEEKR
jgi:hypothetical protein